MSAWDQIFAWLTTPLPRPVALAQVMSLFFMVGLGVGMGWTLRWCREQFRERNYPYGGFSAEEIDHVIAIRAAKNTVLTEVK